MFRNYAQTAFRHLRRYPTYSLINIVGLAVGMASCMLIALYVLDEIRYDAYHEKADRVYRVTQEYFNEDGTSRVHHALIDPPVAPLLKNDFPEIEHAARLTPIGPLMSAGDKHLVPNPFFLTDPDFFDVFTVPFLSGDPGTALAEPFTVVLSRSLATRLFGDADPMGQTILFNNKDPFEVTGVFEDLPAQTHLHFEALGSLSTLLRWFGSDALPWDSPNYLTYVLLDESDRRADLEAQLPAFWNRHRSEAETRTVFHLQPLRDIHLRSHLAVEMEPGGDIRTVYLFALIAAFILVIAGINFMNLSTARSATRAREVGLRKVVGAHRSQLIGQFLGESMLTALLALLLTVAIVELALPGFNRFLGKDLALNTYTLLPLVGLGFLMTFVVGILAGSYPALYLSAFQPTAVLRGRLRSAVGGVSFRTVLVVIQFTLSIGLMIGTMVVYRQLQFLRHQELGFEQEQVVVLPGIRSIADDFSSFRNELRQHPDVLNVTQCNRVPSHRLSIVARATATVAPDRRREEQLFATFIDAEFFPTFEIPFVAGRNFDPSRTEDAQAGFVLNERAVEAFGWDTAQAAIGQPFDYAGRQGHVTGVVRDFHFESLHQEIAPVVFFIYPENYREIAIRFQPRDITSLLRFLEEKWQPYRQNLPLSYYFLDERFEQLYASDKKLGQLIALFSGLALVVACLGLFGLSSFTVERRTKEIGIRRVMGASVPNILMLLTKDFVRLVLISFAVATPIAYLAMQRWMATYAYRADIGWAPPVAAGLLTLLIAWTTVGYLAWRAARLNPAASLRYE